MSTKLRDFLIFSLQGALYALDLAQIAEVGDPPPISPIPLSPACYSGALSFHGEIVAVMNLHAFFGLAANGRPGKIIILNQNDASLAFFVDSVIRIVSEEEVLFLPPPDMPFAASSLGLQDGEAVLLDLAAIVHHAEADMLKKR